MPWTIHRLAAEQDDARGRRGTDADAITGFEGEQASVGEALASDFDLA